MAEALSTDRYRRDPDQLPACRYSLPPIRPAVITSVRQRSRLSTKRGRMAAGLWGIRLMAVPIEKNSMA